MTETLNIALIQADLAWEDPQENLKYFTEKIEAISDSVDLIILPEMFTTAFTMKPEKIAETMRGDTVNWMKLMASKTGAAITGSLIITENDNYFNRLLFVEPSGNLSQYDKRHTFTLAGEDKVYTAGTERLLVNFKGWKICPLICYDLRFPVWARNTEDYDVLIYVANWPTPRVSAWDTLLAARAIENMSYCVGVNRVGVDGVNSEYSGHSAVYDVLGKRLTSFNPNEEKTEIVTLEKRHISAYRNKLKFLQDRDSFTLK